MNVILQTHREQDRAELRPAGPFDLAHAMAVTEAVDRVQAQLKGCRTVVLDLVDLDRIDGTGAALLAKFLDRLEGSGSTTHVLERLNPQAARLITLYRGQTSAPSSVQKVGVLTRLGMAAAEVPGSIAYALDFVGRYFMALPRGVTAPRSVDWNALPRLAQEIGADALLVTSAANLLVGAIIGFLGVSQLGRFGAVAFVPELVAVAHFRELGPLVTAIVVAGRSGAGLASEIATMKVSEEIDALRSMGFDPVGWLVVPRCLALVVILPVLTWIGDVFALVGGLLATTAITTMSPRAYLLATSHAITIETLLTGLVKSPFLGLSIGLIACGQGLATRGGAAAVGARTTSAVVLAIFGVIVIDAFFTLFFTLMST